MFSFSKRLPFVPSAGLQAGMVGVSLAAVATAVYLSPAVTSSDTPGPAKTTDRGIARSRPRRWRIGRHHPDERPDERPVGLADQPGVHDLDQERHGGSDPNRPSTISAKAREAQGRRGRGEGPLAATRTVTKLVTTAASGAKTVVTVPLQTRPDHAGEEVLRPGRGRLAR